MKKYMKYIPFCIFFVYVFFISFVKSPLTGDAIVFAGLKGNLISVLLSRYQTWTSRIIIEGIMIAILRNIPLMWNICNVLIFLLLYYSFQKIFNHKHDFFIDCMIVIFIMLYSYIDMSSAGWSATTINYLWPLALGMFSIIPILSILNGEEVPYSKFILAIPCLFFAANQEQCACLLTGFMFLFLLYYYIKNRKISYTILCYFLISLIGILFSLLAPGNHNRFQSEMVRWFIDYKQLDFFHKLILSIINAFEMFLGKINYIWIAFYGCICYFLHKNKVHKLVIVSGIILFAGTILLPFSPLFSFNDLYNIHHKDSIEVLPYLKIDSLAYYLSFIISIFYIIITAILLLSFQKKDIYKRLLLPIIFFSAILSRMIIGFSPTIFASAFRTGIFMNYLIIMLILLIYHSMKFKIREKKKIAIFLLILFIIKYSFIFYHYFMLTFL